MRDRTGYELRPNCVDLEQRFTSPEDQSELIHWRAVWTMMKMKELLGAKGLCLTKIERRSHSVIIWAEMSDVIRLISRLHMPFGASISEVHENGDQLFQTKHNTVV